MGAVDDGHLMKARLVYDGIGDPIIPPEMGTPTEGKFEGTEREKCAELCGRVCYDSLTGKGRLSKEYHEHIQQVGHLSVYEHTPITVEIAVSDYGDAAILLAVLIGRPGMDVIIVEPKIFRLTYNYRTVLEWDQYTQPVFERRKASEDVACLKYALTELAHQTAPQIVAEPVRPTADVTTFRAERVEPQHDDERWVTLFMAGSRGFSHEQCRHGNFTAISQRSTRYVDESGSPWVHHPLLEKWASEGGGLGGILDVDEFETEVQEAAGVVYDRIVAILQPWLQGRGTNKLTARKQARGTARGFLGNALYTEMMFSASVAQWRRMLGMRATVHADAEIRQVYAGNGAPGYPCVLNALRASRYADQFADYTLKPSPDGIGMVAEIEE